MAEFKVGSKVRMKADAVYLLYYPAPEFFTVVKTYNSPSGSINLLVENPNFPKNSFMSKEWHNSSFFVSL